MDILLYIASGALVGLIVGVTGIGGGALMTPLLLMFGFPPHIAVGTDLMYASLTKAGGAISHHKQKHVEWSLVRLLAIGSIPAALITGFALETLFEDSEQYGALLSSALGIMLLITACVIILRPKIQQWSASTFNGSLSHHRNSATIAMGVFLGVFVTLSSVGAGAIGTAILMLLYPALRSTNIVGTDIAHAVPLTLAAGLIHMYLGNVDFYLLGALLVGSLPAIHLGSRLSRKVPEKMLKPLLAGILFTIGAKYAFF
ncbi:sulfite exporter TauE/SafE family protein [Bacterioplanoides sp. SCSIO 12839]|uniref:sulfite exporter TauE/SafE family protein n=1 Tax=Bacterioplanoides sp. SCSIO 12839 TaxID=2829569 RepID=UPI00210231BA|nr:sulfite exporter TauE/SafE family protein [Bacterioplanoides sp. SCSIO 12839]UTW49891.1 sulfite exporter TauE/SafE family protein [Bacterioplanoides sp. SCSIO 12839]